MTDISSHQEEDEDENQKRIFMKEYEHMLDQYYKILKKNKEAQRRIEALEAELGFLKSNLPLQVSSHTIMLPLQRIFPVM